MALPANLNLVSKGPIYQDHSQKAFEAFEAQGALLIHVDRPRSLLKLPKQTRVVELHKTFRKLCLEKVTKKVAECSDYFFVDLQGNKLGLDEFTYQNFLQKVSHAYPNWKVLKPMAMELVDRETNTALPPFDILCKPVRMSDGPKIDLVCKSFLVKKIKNVEPSGGNREPSPFYRNNLGETLPQDKKGLPQPPLSPL